MTIIDRYTCEEVVRRLDDYVDRELSPREMQLMRQHILGAGRRLVSVVRAERDATATKTLRERHS